MNLHGIVRAMISAVNPDIPGLLLASAGYDTNLDGSRSPKYLQAQSVKLQVQAVSGGDLRHVEFLNLQGELRVVYLFGDIQGVERVAVKGGDMLQFPEYPGAPITNWLVTETVETWYPGWSKVIVTQQLDAVIQ